MPAIPLEVLYEDNHLIAVNKPAGVATMGALPNRPNLVTIVKQYLKHRYAKPGEVYLGVVSRLDSLVTGVVLLARTSKAAARMTQQFAEGAPKKTYWAVVPQVPDPPEGTCIDWLKHEDHQHRVVVAKPNSEGARQARLSYHCLRELRVGSLLEISLETGRKHQIRVQLAQRGWPILGDSKYGSDVSFPAGIALHAKRLEFVHPVRQEAVVIEAPLPPSWRGLGVS